MVNRVHTHYLKPRSCIQECDCNDPCADEPSWMTKEKSVKEHLTRCYHHCKITGNQVLWFIIGTTTSFPIEHAVWRFVWPFKIISKWMGLD